MNLKRVNSVFIMAASVLLASCSGSSDATKSHIVYASSDAAATSGEVLAKIEGEAISEQDLSRELKGAQKGQYIKAKTELYTQQKNMLDEVVFEKLLAKYAADQKKSKEDVLKAEVTSKVPSVKEADAKKMYDEIAAQSKGRGQLPPFKDVKSRIEDRIKAEKEAEIREVFFTKLTSKYKVTYFISPPRLEVSTGNNPMKGNEKAEITIVEFSDFECPFCKKGYDSVNEVMKEYKGKVKLFFRDFPLSFHKSAKPAATAVRCAGEQNKYWEFHDELFENQKTWALRPDRAKNETDADVAQKVSKQFLIIAKKIKLDGDKFTKCVESKKFDKKIDDDMAAGANAGVSGTPAFFINGILLSGAQPFEAFKKVIDEELSRIASSKNPS